jgi:hypothetical protein
MEVPNPCIRTRRHPHPSPSPHMHPPSPSPPPRQVGRPLRGPPWTRQAGPGRRSVCRPRVLHGASRRVEVHARQASTERRHIRAGPPAASARRSVSPPRGSIEVASARGWCAQPGWPGRRSTPFFASACALVEAGDTHTHTQTTSHHIANQYHATPQAMRECDRVASGRIEEIILKAVPRRGVGIAETKHPAITRPYHVRLAAPRIG